MNESQHPHFKVIAHRGNSSQAPENTRASFQQAISLHVDYIECDVQLTKDFVPVVMHDSTVHRILANTEISDVDAMNWDKLKNIDAGSWFDEKYKDERIMSLQEFLKMPKNNVGAMIEIKKDTFKEEWMARIAGDIMHDLRPHYEHHVVVGSLSPDINRWLEGHLPFHDFIAIVGNMNDFDIFLNETRAKYFALRYTLATKEIVHMLRDKGKEVWTWTVDDKDTAKKLIADGVQGIITNHPKKMQSMHMAVAE